MRRFSQATQCVAVGVLAISIGACGGGGDDDGGGGPTSYSVGGAVTGLAGSGLTLLNGGATLAVSVNGSFTFPGSVANGGSYAVTVGTQPSNPAQTCAVTNGSGTVSGANVTSVAVACTTRTFTIGGAVTGLNGSGLVLRNNGGNDLAVAANGAFTFTTPVASGAAYAVSVQTQPPGQTCTVTNGAANVGAANVTNVSVLCANMTFTIGGVVTGLNGAGLVLQNNGGADLSIAANGAFVFPTALNNGDSYTVTVRTQPQSPTQICSINNGAGSIAGSTVGNITVACGDVVPRFIYSMNPTQGTFSTFRIDATNGQLRSAGYSKLGANPVNFRVVPSPLDANVGFFYAVNTGAPPSITAAVIDRFIDPVNRVPNTGPVAGSPFLLPAPSSILMAHPNNRILYLPHGSTNNISAFAINETTGALSPVPGSPFATGTLPSSILLSTNGQFAYVMNRTSQNIYVYSINTTTGVLTEIPAHRIPTGTTPNAMSMYPGINVLYVANQGSSNVSGYSMDSSTGALTPVPGSPFAAGLSPIVVIFHPSGRYAYSLNAGSNDMSGYAVDAATGSLTALGGSPFAAGAVPVGLVFDATQRFTYAPTTAGTIAAFSVDASTGVLTPIGAVLAGTPGQPPRLVGEASGKYLYAGNPADNTIRSFNINQSTGALTPFTDTPIVTTGAGVSFLVPAPTSATPVTVIPKYVHIANDGGAGNGAIATYSVNVTTGLLSAVGSPVPTGVAPSSVAATPSGKYVYVANEDSDSISGYLASTGVLTTLGPPTMTPAGPRFIDVDASGRFLFAASDSAISVYRIDAANGALTAVGAPIAANADTLDVDHNGRCLFASDNVAGDVLAYSINSETGALTAANDSPFAAGDSPVEVKVHPSGRFVYTTNDGDNTVSAYAITTASANACALTPIGPPASAGPAGFGITSIAIEPTGRFAYVGNEATGAVSIMSINQSSGALTLVDTVHPGAAEATVYADASGKFLYVATQLPTPSGGVLALKTYAINAATGAITSVDGSIPAIPNANAGTITAEMLQ